VAIVPAAGKGERFGASPKLWADVSGEPLLNRTIISLLEAGVDRVIVVLAPERATDRERLTRVAALADPRVEIVTNPDPARGMFSSIHAGLHVVGAGDPILVLPGDMPFVRATTVAAVIAVCARTGRVVTARYGDRSGHPVALPARLGRDILAKDASATLSAVLRDIGGPREFVDVDDAGVVRDVDVMGDLES
jgi:molybdenum cofactor cytidylyltransferase